MTKSDWDIAEHNRILDEMQHRTEVENEAFELMAQGKFDEARELVETLDDELLKFREWPGEEEKADINEIAFKLSRLLKSSRCLNIETIGSPEKSKFAKLVDRMCELHPECENYHETKVIFCEEFLKTIKNMQGTELEPYLAEIKATPHDGCFNIGFKIPLVSYSELKNLQSQK